MTILELVERIDRELATEVPDGMSPGMFLYERGYLDAYFDEHNEQCNARCSGYHQCELTAHHIGPHRHGPNPEGIYLGLEWHEDQ